MKITIDTENKTLILLEEIDLLDLVLFVEGIANISDWKVVPYTKTITKIDYAPYVPYVQPYVQPYRYDTGYPYKITCNTTSLKELFNQSSSSCKC